MFSNATLPEIPIPSQKPQEIRTKNAHNNLADDDLKCKILVSFPRQVDLNADLAKISNSLRNCFQDQLEQAGSNDPGLLF